jgi:hypothetical protein
MKHIKLWGLGLCLWGALSLVISCGGSAENTGSDSNTHWLEACDSDGDCDGLSCLCGVCTAPCEVGSDCRALGQDAVCEVPSSCGKQGASACVRDDGGSAGGTSNTGGSSAEAGTGQTLPDPECPAMDAHNGPLSCATVVGYAFDGKVCGPILCSCEGSECDSMYLTADECDSAYKSCYAKLGVERSCTTNADCALRRRACCPACVPAGLDVSSFVGATRSSPLLEDVGMCVGDPDNGCPACGSAQNPALYSVCLLGECRPIDLSEQAECETSADCQLVSSECGCDCAAGYPGMALNVSTTSLPYCPGAACGLCTYEGGKQYGATCNPDVGKCEMFTTTF